MSTESREHLSCLMDGEINRETGRFLVRRLGADRELCATWARYHLVRDCLRNQDGGLAGNGLSGRVRRAIEDHQAPTSAARRARDWLRPAAGLAVAASVAGLEKTYFSKFFHAKTGICFHDWLAHIRIGASPPCVELAACRHGRG